MRALLFSRVFDADFTGPWHWKIEKYAFTQGKSVFHGIAPKQPISQACDTVKKEGPCWRWVRGEKVPLTNLRIFRTFSAVVSRATVKARCTHSQLTAILPWCQLLVCESSGIPFWLQTFQNLEQNIGFHLWNSFQFWGVPGLQLTQSLLDELPFFGLYFPMGRGLTLMNKIIFTQKTIILPWLWTSLCYNVPCEVFM